MLTKPEGGKNKVVNFDWRFEDFLKSEDIVCLSTMKQKEELLRVERLVV